MIILVVKFTDIGSYFAGRKLGRHKLIPWLSPGKTWEGLVCGVFTAGLMGMRFAAFIERLLWGEGFIFGRGIGGGADHRGLQGSPNKRGGRMEYHEQPMFPSSAALRR